jgi:DNA-3-methyladenine glycosylase I
MLTTAHSRQHHAFEKSPSSHMKNLDRKLQQAMNNATSKYMQRIYPLGIQRSSSNLTLSSLSLSQNSNDSSLSSSNSSWEPKVPLLYGGTFSPWGDVLVSLEMRREDDDKASDHDVEGGEDDFDCSEPGSLHRCSWITKNSDEAYVQFHDECWGVPVYSDKYLPPHFSSNLPVTVTITALPDFFSSSSRSSPW